MGWLFDFDTPAVLLWIVPIHVFGSTFLLSYFKRAAKEEGKNWRWWEDEYLAKSLIVVAWPICLPLSVPFVLGGYLGKKSWVRVHRGELVQKKLGRESQEVHY